MSRILCHVTHHTFCCMLYVTHLASCSTSQNFDEAKIVSNFGKERQTGAMSTNVTSVSPKIKFSIHPSLISISRDKLLRYNSFPVVSASGFTSHFADPVPEFTSTTKVLFSSSTSHIAFLPLQSRQSPSMELFYFYSWK